MAGTKPIIGTSFESFDAAAAAAFEQVKGDARKEGYAAATVVELSMEKGGFVGQVQYRVSLRPGSARSSGA